MPFIYILAIDPIDERYLISIRKDIEETFDYPIKVSNSLVKCQVAFDYSREQYKSTTLLKYILEAFPPDALKVIAVTDVDLFVPVLTFVFGEAQFNGTVAVISITRLKNEFYGLPKNEDLLISRIKKEIIHELGHTFGLYHCLDYRCVMNSSMYAENIDLKNDFFCSNCRNQLSENIINNQA